MDFLEYLERMTPQPIDELFDMESINHTFLLNEPSDEDKLKYRVRRRAQLRSSTKTYHKKYPDAVTARSNNRRARKSNVSGRINSSHIQDIGVSQDWLCRYCGIPCAENYEVDHIIPLAKGGDNTPENLCIACRSCNRSKGDKLPSEWLGK